MADPITIKQVERILGNKFDDEHLITVDMQDIEKLRADRDEQLRTAIHKLIADLVDEQQQAIRDNKEHPETVSFDLSEGYVAAYQDAINKLKIMIFGVIL